MASLIGKMVNAGPPVPITESAPRMLPGTGLGQNTDLTLIRAYKTNGTAQSNVSLLASATAAPPWKLFRAQPVDGRRRYSTSDEGSDQRQEVIQHAALNVLNHPAMITVNGITIPALTRTRLMELSGIWLESVGKSHWVIDWSTMGPKIPLGLWPVRPDRMTPVPDRRNFLAGWWYTAPDGAERIPLLPTDVIYNCYPDPEDVLGGVGPLASVLTDIESSRWAAEWNRNFYLNSAEPGGVIQIDHKTDDTEFNDLVNRWRESHRGVARAHRIAVLEQGATWVPNEHNSQRDMDFINGRSQNRDIIREALGMHKVMTGVTDDVNRANAQTGEEVFASWKVSPRLDRWKDVFNSQLLPLFGKAGQGVEFDYVYPMPQNREQDALELTTRANAALALITAGFDPSDVAEYLGLPAMKVRELATQQPALPPGWVAPGPGGAPGGGDGAAAPGQSQQGAQDALDRALRARAGWDSPLWRDLAAFNRLRAGAR